MNTPDRHPHHSTGKTAAIRLLTAVTVAALLCVTFFVARHVGTECGRDNARRDITVKISFDGGATWPEENKVLLDAGDGWGYSCLTMIDRETVGILYESSQAHMTFQAIPLTDLLP